MTPKDREEYVRSRWEPWAIRWTSCEFGPMEGTRLHVGSKEFFERNSVGSVELYMIPGLEERLWASAYVFTVEREEQIRQVEEEIDIAMFCIANLKQVHVPAAKRILARLQTALAELRKGMRQ